MTPNPAQPEIEVTPKAEIYPVDFEPTLNLELDPLDLTVGDGVRALAQ
jgi:hypothetical protein